MGELEAGVTRTETVHVERWPTEIPLFVLVALAAIAIWILLLVSVVGAVYALLIGLFFFVAHLLFVAHLRGSSVRLGPEQFPELHRRVGELAAKAGIQRLPEAYLMESGGTINALATRFFRSRMIVLFADLLEACRENTSARDMVIGHELGHIKAGHLRWMWFLVPGYLVPFLGAAYSRAREYTCDRYGAALCGDRQGALTGLAILAAGGAHGPRVNLQALARQRDQMNTGWMTLAKWLRGHPPLCERVAELEPALVTGLAPSARGPIRALALLASFSLLMFGAGAVAGMKLLPNLQEMLRQAERQQQQGWQTANPSPIDSAQARQEAEADLKALADLAEEYRRQTGKLPADSEALYGVWRTSRGHLPEPVDPFDGRDYGYEAEGSEYVLWSSGPDGQSDTADDIKVFSAPQASPALQRGSNLVFEVSPSVCDRHSVSPSPRETLLEGL